MFEYSNNFRYANSANKNSNTVFVFEYSTTVLLLVIADTGRKDMVSIRQYNVQSTDALLSRKDDD